MQLNIKKIDERIQKLQEIRRIAADPELIAMLFEFIATGDERTEPVPVSAHAGQELRPRADAAVSPHVDEVDIVNQVVKGMDAQEAAFGPEKERSDIFAQRRGKLWVSV